MIAGPSLDRTLTNNQARVARQLVAGRSVPEIATALEIALESVKRQVKQIRKLYDPDKHRVTFEVFLDRLLRQQLPETGTSVLDCVLTRTAHEVFTDAALLLHAGFRSWMFHRCYRKKGAFVSEWESAAGDIATLINHELVRAYGATLSVAK